MTTTVDVPTSINLTQMRAMLDCIGLGHRMDDLVSFVADPDGVHVTLTARDEDGKLYAAGNNLATHVISVKLDQQR